MTWNNKSEASKKNAVAPAPESKDDAPASSEKPAEKEVTPESNA
jgi:hypothetical protein